MAFPERTRWQGAWRVRRHHAMTQPAKGSEIYDSKEFKKMLLGRVNRNNAVQKKSGWWMKRHATSRLAF